jgi:hypothetical protein
MYKRFYCSLMVILKTINQLLKTTACWDIAPNSLDEVKRHFRSAYHLHRRDYEGSTHL